MKGLEKRCFIEGLRGKYRRAKKKGKSEILDMVQECLGVSRRQARRLMVSAGVGRPRNRRKAGRPDKYQDAEAMGAKIARPYSQIMPSLGSLRRDSPSNKQAFI